MDIAHCRGVTLPFLQNSRSPAPPRAAENASWSKQEAFAGYNPLTQHWQTMALYMLASAAMDLIVTQVVDGTKGFHAMIPKGIFRR